MMDKFDDLVIPTFHVALDNTAQLVESVARIRQGDGKYSAQDMYNLNDWIGLCAFQFMADKWEMRKGSPATVEDLSNYRFYFAHCGDVAYITNDILKKANMNFTWANTKNITQGTQRHIATLADAHMREGDGTVIYDQSIPQFFDTDKNGKLKQGKTIWENRSMKFFAQELLATDDGYEVGMELLGKGSSFVLSSHINAYLNAYVSSTRKTYPEYKEQNFTKNSLFQAFQQNKNYQPNNSRVMHRAYNLMPGDIGFEERAVEIFAYQQRLQLTQ